MGARFTRFHGIGAGQHERCRAIVDAGGVAGRDRAAIALEGRLHRGQHLQCRVGLDVFVRVEAHLTPPRGDLHRNDLLLETARLDRRGGALVAGHGEFVHHPARDAESLGDVFRCHPHVDVMEQVVQCIEHQVSMTASPMRAPQRVDGTR